MLNNYFFRWGSIKKKVNLRNALSCDTREVFGVLELRPVRRIRHIHRFSNALVSSISLSHVNDHFLSKDYLVVPIINVNGIPSWWQVSSVNVHRLSHIINVFVAISAQAPGLFLFRSIEFRLTIRRFLILFGLLFAVVFTLRALDSILPLLLGWNHGD